MTCTTDQQLDPIRRQLSYITVQLQQQQKQLQQQQQQQTFDRVLSKIDALSVCQKVLVQQNVDGSKFFQRTWSDFKTGFGNEQLHRLTQDNKYKLRFEVQTSNTSGLWYWAEYDTFVVGNESTQYKLTIGGFSGSVVDNPMIYHNGMKFSTIGGVDNDLDSGNCADGYGAGFWYNKCFNCGVNMAGDHFSWHYWSRGSFGNLKTSRMWLVCR